MAFTKITEADLQNKGVIGLPDTPGLSTTEMQEKFDEIALDVLYPKHNEHIDELVSASAAGNIGALNVGGTESTIQRELDDRYTKSVEDQLFDNKVDKEPDKGLSTNDFTDAYRNKLNNIEDNANNYALPKGSQSSLGGVMGDGTTFTIDENGVGHAVGGGGGGTADYNALINKPKLNGKTVSGDNASEYYGIIRPLIVVTSEAGSTVSIKKGTEVIVATPKTSTTWEVHPTSYGEWTVESDLPGADIATSSIVIDTVKTYAITVEHITATITATYQSGATCTCSKGSTVYTATSNPQTFTVRSLGTWTVETVYDGIHKTATATISADGDSQSVTLEYATINITYGNAFRGVTITCTDGNTVYTKTAPTTGNTMAFTIPTSGTWSVSGTVGGDTYTKSVVVSSMTSYSIALNVFNATVTITFPYTEGASCTLSDGVTTLTADTSPMAFGVPNVGTWTATCDLDGAEKSESFVITTDGQTESTTFTYGTINLTYDNEFRGLTLTCNDGVTTITKTAPSASNTMSFYPPNTGTWTISGTYSGTPYSVDAEVDDLSVSVSAQLRTYIVATVTLHGANEATIKYVDIGGLQTQTLDEYGEKSNVTITCSPNNPYVTFVDNDKSKVPEKLDEKYFKRVQITSATTDIYIMPDNSLYWYGYESDNVEDATTANGWTYNGTLVTPTHHTRDVQVYANGGSTTVSMFGSKNSISNISKINSIAKRTSGAANTYMHLFDAKSGNASSLASVQFNTVDTLTYYSKSVTNLSGYLVAYSNNGASANVSALWYSTTTPTTPTYYSAACDVIYIKDTSDNVIPIAYTDSEGKCYDAISLPNGTYTFYSTVAKDPNNLSNPYSKTITITSETTDIWVMPSNTLYWYGYNGGMDSALNQSWSIATTRAYEQPTINKNNVRLQPSANNKVVSYVSTSTHTTNKYYAIYQSTAVSTFGIIVQACPSKNREISNGSSYNSSTSLQLGELVPTDTTIPCYINIEALDNTRNGNLYAVWYE